MGDKAVERKRGRDDSFDFVKGILIFLGVYGHTIVVYGQVAPTIYGDYGENLFFSVIYSFHMPLFVFISGYFATHTLNKTMSECARKVWHRLLIPAMIWSVVQFLIFYWGGYARGLDSMVMDSLRSVWFLYCIASLYLVGNCVFKFGKWKYPIAVVLMVVMYLCYKLPGVAYIEYFQPIRQWPLFVMGVFYYEYKQNLSPSFLKILVAVSTMVYVCLYIWLASNHPLEYIRSSENYLLRAVVYQTGTITWFAVFRMLYHLIATSRIASYIVIIGRNTLGIYVTNSKWLMIVTLIVAPAILLEIPQWLTALITTMLLLGFTLFLKRNKFLAEYLLGERYKLMRG